MSKTTVPLAIATLFALQSLAFTPAAAQELGFSGLAPVAIVRRPS